MSIIGNFTLQENGVYTGKIVTLALSCKAQIVPIAEPAKEGPVLRIYSGEVEIGAGWVKHNEDDGTIYYSVKIDEPSLAQPIYGALFNGKNEGEYDLVWSRRRSA